MIESVLVDQKSAETYRRALELVWKLYTRKEVHLGLERMSGIEQGCIACICWAALSHSATLEDFDEALQRLKAP